MVSVVSSQYLFSKNKIYERKFMIAIYLELL